VAKKRLDILLVERGMAPSRERAKAIIMAGEVFTGEQKLTDASKTFDPDVELSVRNDPNPYVSRGGLKLSHALERFSISVEGLVCIDVGSSTGGFTDCLLQAGAKHVFAVDVGYGQLDYKLRTHPQVSVLERTNARHLEWEKLKEVSPLAADIRLATMDVSFINAEKIIIPLSETIQSLRTWVILFKPQFEVGKKAIGKKGLVRDAGAVVHALASFESALTSHGLRLVHRVEPSPLAGKKSGNLEYLLHYEKS